MSGSHYEFGQFRLFPAERLLLRGTEAVALAPRAFDTLLLLVKHRGRILEKEVLMKKMWPGAFVEENNLNQIICTLRKALGADACGARYIETVSRRGYRFVASVKKLSAERN
ncbi:MAG: winged helix-turn-helix domain-containing protein, partial [Blastocatellia bacterium]